MDKDDIHDSEAEITLHGHLKHLDLHSFESRKVWGDLIKILEWTKEYDKSNINKILTVN